MGIFQLCVLSAGKKAVIYYMRFMHIDAVQEFDRINIAFLTNITVTVYFVITAWPSLKFHFSAADSTSRTLAEMWQTSKNPCSR